MRLLAKAARLRDQAYFKAYLLLKRLKLKTETWLLKRQIKLRGELYGLALLRLRILDRCDEKIGVDKKIDSLYFTAARRFLAPLWFDKSLAKVRPDLVDVTSGLRDEYEQQQLAIDALIASHQEDATLKTAMHLAYSIQYRTADWLRRSGEMDFYKLALDGHSLAPLSLDWAGVTKWLRWARRELKFCKQELRERFVLKINFSVEDILKWSGLFYSTLLLGAYCRAWLLYGNFGINVSDYFSLSDYLAGGLEALGAGALSGGIVMLFMFLGAQRASGSIYAPYSKSFSQNGIFRFSVISNLLVMAVPLYAALSGNKIAFYLSLHFSIGFFSLSLSSSLTQKFFKRSPAPLFVLNFLVLFSGYIYTMTMVDVTRLKDHPQPDCDAFKFSQEFNSSSCDLVLIGATERNVFFFNIVTHKAVAVPSEAVEARLINPSSRIDLYESMGMLRRLTKGEQE